MYAGAVYDEPHRHGRASPPSDPQRVVQEENLCPVCNSEYPANVIGNAQRQEEHIMSCIEEQLGRSNLSTRPSPAADGAQAAGAPVNPQFRPRAMTKYTATEKDAKVKVSGDNEETRDECQFCLDDFLPSQELALLEGCLCKFHSDCILTWWNAGHYGKCPTHDHGMQ